MAALTSPDHIAALNGRWDGECSIHGDQANATDSEKTNVWLGCHLAFSPLDGTLTIEHPHNAAALCFATYRIRGHGHSIGTIDGSGRRLIPFQLNGLLDGSSGAFELTVTAKEGEYQSALTSHGTVDFANRSMMADSKNRVGTLRLSYSGNQNTMTSTLRPHLSPKAVARHLGLLSSAECGSGRPRSGAVLAKVITPAIAPCTPLQAITPGTTVGPDPLAALTNKDGTVRVWHGQLVRHGTEHTAILSECVLAFNVSNDIGTIIGTGMASWEGYRVSFTLEGSFDHKHRVTVVWAEVAVKLMTEPPQCEKYTVCIDVANRRIEGHNAFGRLKLEPYTGLPPVAQASPIVGMVSPAASYNNMAKMNEQHAVNEAASNMNNPMISTTMVPTMMSQSQATITPYPVYPRGALNAPPPPPMMVAGNNSGNAGTDVGGIVDGNHGSGVGDDGSSYGTNGGMMYGPQMTPQGITYALMPTAMAMQAHAVTAQMLYGSANNGGYPPYVVDTNVAPAAAAVGAGDNVATMADPACMSSSQETSEGDTSGMETPSSSNSSSAISTPSDGRSRTNSDATGSPPSSGPASPLIAGAGGNVTIDASLPLAMTAGAMDENAGLSRPRRYSVTTSSSTPRNRSGSDASGNGAGPLQQFEIGDRVYMYTLPSNIVQSVLLRGPITAQALKDSPYPYHSPSQLHYNPGILVRSEKRGSRRASQSRASGPSSGTKGSGGAGASPLHRGSSTDATHVIDQQTSGNIAAAAAPSPSSPPSSSLSMASPSPAAAALQPPPPQQQQQQQQSRVVGMSSNPNAAGGKKSAHKWSHNKVRNNNAPGGPRI